MPLVRFQLRNEYGLADPELYSGPTTEDPRTAFEGIAVAGLVGILRQLGDLAEFAADVFHDLHEEVINTGARGQKILGRVQKIESALLPLEKAVQNQRSHIHFAYIAGCDWRADIRTAQNQLICSELPQYMIDSYEECRDPPRLYMLDKFDSAGAGACLRKYSDPSYFRRALASSEPPKPEKVKRKKRKGSRLRSRDIQQVLTPRQSSSTQFGSPSTDRLSFSVENISVTDTRPKSELEREFTSFDSETRVNFEDTDTSFMLHDELEYNASSASTSNINPTDAFVPVLHNDSIEDTVDDDSQNDLLQQQTVPSSSSVMWDEKTEIAKPASPKMCEILVDRVEDAESLPLGFKTSNSGCQNSKLGGSNQEYIIFDIGKVPLSLSGGKHFDEVSNETENYMDANNILESELEMDGECEPKQELEPLSNLNHADSKPEPSELKGATISSFDCFDSPAPTASCSSTNDYISPRLSNLIPSECLDCDQSICTSSFAPNCDSFGNDTGNHISNVSVVNGSEVLNGDLSPVPTTVNEQLELVEGNKHDSVGFAPKHDSVGNDSGNHISNVSVVNGSEVLNCDLSPVSSTVIEQLELDEATEAKIMNPQDPPFASLRAPSFNCWTNGGIFGVEPSKPPDFSILHGTVATSETPVISRESMVEDSAKSHPVKQSSREPSQGHSLGELVRNGEVSTNGTYAHDHGLDQKETNATTLGSNLLRCATIGSQFNSCDQGISASISDLAQRFISNSLQRRIYVNHADVSTTSSSESVNSDFRKPQEMSLQNGHQGLSNGVLSHRLHGLDKERMEVGSLVPANSPETMPSSPPLEHMKISFHPLNGLQTSKLKLEFSGGNVHESNGDLTFPSFHLIPGPSTDLLDSGSESDDDTFCRSSYSSQGLLSPQSDSDSELWGEDKKSGTQEHEISDNSCRVSSTTTSICSSLEFEKMDRCGVYPATLGGESLKPDSVLVPFDSDPMRDLPGIDTLIFSKKQEHNICDASIIDPIDSNPVLPDELPLLPPLPPMQWRVVKPYGSLEDNSSGDHLDAHTESSVTLEQREKDAPREPCNAEAVVTPREKHDQQNLNGHRELRSSSISKEPDEQEDFLHQIRSKSFNLRRTVTVQQSHIPEPETNVNVVAILAKADVIRQAFACNNKGGDDDSWSEG